MKEFEEWWETQIEDEYKEKLKDLDEFQLQEYNHVKLRVHEGWQAHAEQTRKKVEKLIDRICMRYGHAGFDGDIILDKKDKTIVDLIKEIFKEDLKK